MGAKDVREKHLLSLNDVFAAMWNFRSKYQITPDGLTDAPTEFITLVNEGYVHRYRDILKYYRNEFGLSIAMFGLENQTDQDKTMAVRVMTYDALCYHAQLNSVRMGEKLIPVFTQVLYFGYHERWTAPRSLREQCNLPSELAEQFQNYKIEVIELAWLSDEEIENLTGDLKVAAIFLRQLRMKDKCNWPDIEIEHGSELLDLFTEITGNTVFRQMKRSCAKRKGRLKMNHLLGNYEKTLISRGEKRGKKLGEIEGKKLGLKEGELNNLLALTKRIMQEDGKSLEESMRYLRLTDDEKSIVRNGLAT